MLATCPICGLEHFRLGLGRDRICLYCIEKHFDGRTKKERRDAAKNTLKQLSHTAVKELSIHDKQMLCV